MAFKLLPWLLCSSSFLILLSRIAPATADHTFVWPGACSLPNIACTSFLLYYNYKWPKTCLNINDIERIIFNIFQFFFGTQALTFGCMWFVLRTTHVTTFELKLLDGNHLIGDILMWFEGIFTWLLVFVTIRLEMERIGRMDYRKSNEGEEVVEMDVKAEV